MGKTESQEQSLVDESHVLHLLRVFLGVAQGTQDETQGEDEESAEEQAGAWTPRIRAGCTLWDLCATEYHSAFLLQNSILEVLLQVLYSTKMEQEEEKIEPRVGYRVIEVVIGILANISAHPKLVKEHILQSNQLCLTLSSIYIETEQTAILSESSRVLTAVAAAAHGAMEGSKWKEVLGLPELLEKLVFCLRNSLDATLLYRSAMLAFYVGYYDGTRTALKYLAIDLDLAGAISDVLREQLDLLEHALPGETVTGAEYILRLLELVSNDAELLETELQVITVDAGQGGAEEKGKEDIIGSSKWRTLVRQVGDILVDEDASLQARESCIMVLSNILEVAPGAATVINDSGGALNQAIEMLSYEVLHRERPEGEESVLSAAALLIHQLLSCRSFPQSSSNSMLSVLRDDLPMLLSSMAAFRHQPDIPERLLALVPCLRLFLAPNGGEIIKKRGSRSEEEGGQASIQSKDSAVRAFSEFLDQFSTS